MAISLRSKTQDELNDEHLIRPQPGDYWFERCCPIRVVLWVDGEHLEYLDFDTHRMEMPGVVETVNSRWIWNVSVPAIRCTYEEFAKYLKYNSIPGTWADVAPEKLLCVVDEWKAFKRRK